MLRTDRDINAHARGEVQSPALYKRTWRPNHGFYKEFGHVIAVADGNLNILSGSDDLAVAAPAACYFPASDDLRIESLAGTVAYVAGFSDELLIDALGNAAESLSLRILSERPAVASNLGHEPAGELVGLVTGYIKELDHSERGSWLGLTAYVRLVFLALARASGSQQSPNLPKREISSLLQKFRQLVELHFRHQWGINRYAGGLNVTYDRLHDICHKQLGRTPIQLVHERSINEAQLRLERTGSSIQSIAEALGFGDATYFSHFFKRKTGYSPLAFRKLARQREDRQSPAFPQTYADWP